VPDQPCVVIDTNVWAIAEGMHQDASDQCVAACLALLRQVAGGLLLAVDDGDEVLTECISVLQTAKTSGFAKKLITRIWHTRWDAKVCKRVPITACAEPPPSYDEIPPSLHNFDADDQKFLAVALCEGNKPLLFAGLDGEWWDRQADLQLADLNVQFVCPADLFARAE
jgi:hypothetical protein